MTRTTRLLLPLALLTLAVPATAQAPKPGAWYEETVDVGFKIKVPKNWDLIPPQPGEQNLIAKYDPPTNKYINLNSDDVLFLHVWLAKFDRRPDKHKSGKTIEVGGEEIDVTMPGHKNVLELVSGEMRQATNWTYDKKKYPKELKGVKKTTAEYYVLEGSKYGTSRGQKVYAYAAVFKLADDLEVALLGNGPPDKKKWRVYEKAFQKMAKSFQRLEIESLESNVSKVGSGDPRAKKRAQLEFEVAKSNGAWKLHETDNYFIVSSNDDEEFMKELMFRLEAIRAVYSEDYPAEKARIAVVKKDPEIEAGAPAGGGDGGAGGEPDPDADVKKKEKENETFSVQSPLERSRLSVVRVCKNQGEYHSYGGPGGSAGYWSAWDEELVVFDDKASGGRRDTWATLNHEAFHQYIYYFYGKLSPHSWYNEGTGDFYSGFQFKTRKFKLRPFDWRKGLIKDMIGQDRYVPLKDIVRWTQREYYGGNDLGIGGGECYAQGWSMIWFLRQGRMGNVRNGWNEDWNDILEVYLDTLADTGDLDAAVDAAFGAVDWNEMETAWKNFVG